MGKYENSQKINGGFLKGLVEVDAFWDISLSSSFSKDCGGGVQTDDPNLKEVQRGRSSKRNELRKVEGGAYVL